ncbi:uncharacterized protein LOC123383546 [Felis catus]|uniref:uncharacterized protein LOC123383546 n=1 Tax=Felis catus TaxID=9685 RepID=UPI001D1A08D7|nr:uncharacterized protein LOC123383546 [Felis catus]XP_044907350.1 uncharacterized protein LOC123383546 [Felis catus]XP_044907351.1 uncharacterized protein LOC123383546 [Felis catus]XP_044907353.1 uncharacterized protein LOC123383546 [Felis catus]XP_044907354.1 uncharacterized protein LOC123383546 [Felis catus]XP_044907355.1 uncharacterized protein LOC123383546 [Felis catus]XP_044907356.1 uncharacterized protein LOC123383546 [Felis catus]XP_044907357.1 uncharacterized protein LOC123383546 [
MSELVQVLWFSRRFLTRAAESQVTSPSAEDEVARGTIERLVPLVPDIEVAPAEVRRGRSGRGRVPDPRALAGLFRGGPQSGCTPPSPRQHYHAAQLSQLPGPRSLLHPAHAGAHLGEEAAEEQPEDATNHVSQPGLRRPPLQARTKLPRLLPGAASRRQPHRKGEARGARGGRPLRWAQPAFASRTLRVARLRGGARRGGARLSRLGEDEWGQALGAGPAPYREKRRPQSSGEWVVRAAPRSAAPD